MHGIPIMRSLYRKLLMDSVHCFIAVNSDPNKLVSINVYFFDIQNIKAQFRNTRNPVLERRVRESPA